MWDTILKKSQEEKQFWCLIEEGGHRYEGADSRFKALRAENTVHLYEAVKKNGWPSILTDGEEINEAAYSIARASIQNPEKMKYFLSHLSQSVHLGQSRPVQLAALEDCIRYYEGIPQVCGLFLEWKLNGELYANVNSIGQANNRRAELGLPSVQEAIQLHLRELALNPGAKPKDIAAHNAMHTAWAKSVGW